jgi:ABC-type branched-subunit amino acid transport system permease subunit
MNSSPNRTKRLALVISGATDALLGGILLLLGFDFLPMDVTDYGFQNWHVVLLGGILFITGMIFVVYNLSRWDE